MDIEEFRKAGYKAIDDICDYYATLGDRPVLAQVDPGFLINAIPSQAPEKGEPFEEISKDYQNLVLPGMTNWQHPSFFGYFPSNATFAGILGDLYSSAVSNPGFNWLCSPSCTELEQVVMDWCAKLLGLDESFHVVSGLGGGAIQGSASDSALVIAIAARIRFVTAHPDVPLEKLVLYVSTQTHSIGVKTALLLGIAYRALPVLAEDAFALRGDVLRQAYVEDRAAGRWPFALFATVGTTSSGAVDRLDEIGPLVKTFPDFWMHVDAAWAGVSYSCPEYREVGRLAEVNRYADSFCTNFHKWGLVNFDASAMWLRDRKHLTEALDITPAYLRTKHGDAGTVIDYRNWQVALGRRFRSAKVWFVLRTYGAEGFREHIRKDVRLGAYFENLIEKSSCFERVAPRSLSLNVFRLIIPNTAHQISIEDLNKLNLEFHRRLAELSEQIFLTRTDLNGAVAVRLSLGAERTQETHIRAAFDLMSQVGAQVLHDAGNVALN